VRIGFGCGLDLDADWIWVRIGFGCGLDVGADWIWVRIGFESIRYIKLKAHTLRTIYLHLAVQVGTERDINSILGQLRSHSVQPVLKY
jgi:hypothetical protein